MSTETVMRDNIITAIRQMRADGATGASLECLKQCTSTRGLMCSKAEYERVFDEQAREVAKRLRFTLCK